MKLCFYGLLFGLMAHAIAASFIPDPRCGASRRELTEADKIELKDENEKTNQQKLLRGRQLHVGDHTEFHIKLDWFLGACWQQEYDIHRRWCWQCRGDDCNENDPVVLQECRDVMTQYWTYNDNGRISPLTNANWCLERTSASGIVLRACNTTNTQQQFIGFNTAGRRFELTFPNDATNCLSLNDGFRHPQAGVDIQTRNCAEARQLNTHEWILFDPRADDGAYAVNSLNRISERGTCSDKLQCRVCEG